MLRLLLTILGLLASFECLEKPFDETRDDSLEILST